MKKVLGIVLGGLQKRIIALVLAMLLVTSLAYGAVAFYQSKMLTDVVGETRAEQQQAISRASDETMHAMLEGSLVSGTALQASLADHDFAELVNDLYMLQTMAEGLLENRESLTPLLPTLPDLSLDGEPSSFVLHEQGVDYTQSQLLGAVAHMGSPMIALQRNSDKIDGCYVGLSDGTHFGVDDKTADKYDENGELILFPVRQRPWYKGAVEKDGLYFTGLVQDAFNGTYGISCSVPVHLDGEIVGAAGLDIILESMLSFTGGDGSRGSYAYVVNQDGQVLLGPSGGGVFTAGTGEDATELFSLGNDELTRLVEQALRETTGLETVTLDGRVYYLVGSPMPTVGWAVISLVDEELTEMPEKQLLAEYDRINDAAVARFGEDAQTTRRTLFYVLGAIVLNGLIAALLASKSIVRPIEQMTRSIVHSGQTGQPFEFSDKFKTNDEIELLAEAYDDLSRKTRNYIDQITTITAEKERISTELSLATKIQAAMMPHIFPAFPERSEIDVYACMDPAKEVGGDFYDFFLIDEDHLCMVIADVSGKGVPAALFMMASKIILQSFAMLGVSPADILTRTNQAICSNNQEEMFVTVWVGILEISTGKLTAANAGHEFPVLKHPDGSFAPVKDKHGFVVGAMENMVYEEYTLELKPGSKLFLYTDGVPEATDADKQLFGMERMLQALNANPDAAPDELLRQVRAAVDGFVREAEQFDDLTMLCMEYKGPSPRDELRLEASEANLARVQDYVEQRLEAAGCPMKTRMQVSVVVEEIFVNIASYAYAPETGEATVRFELPEPGLARITFMDSGTAYNPLAREDPDISLPAQERDVGGLGVYMTKKLMDEVRYDYREGHNVLSIEKRF